MHIDEIEAFQQATKAASARGLAWRPPFWIDLVDDEWRIQAESECVVRILTNGEVAPEPECIQPEAALAAAKAYALKNDFSWKPAFSLELRRGRWIVGACQSQFGGQTHFEIDASGSVVASRVNPK